jgi:O-antigen ligase
MLSIPKIQKLFAATMLPGIFILQIILSGFLKDALTMTEFAVYAIIVFGGVFTLHILEKKNDPITIKLIDLLLLAYLSYRFIRGLIFRGPDYFSSQWIGEFAICFVYLIVRFKPAFKEPVIWSVILIGIAECVTAILQVLHLVNSGDNFFQITGTFSNPGQLGGFIAVQIFLTIYMLTRHWKQAHITGKIIFSGLLILSCCVLVLSRSRAAWLAVFAGIAYMLFYKGTSAGSSIRLKYVQKSKFKVLLVVLILILTVLLYFYKKDSADGRLLIWRVTLNMIADQPLWGHGPGSFQKEYFTYQSKYFSKNPGSRFLMLADNPSHTFNEYLQMTAELGFHGLLIVLLLIAMVFSFRLKSKEEILLKASFLAFCLFAFFSYPSEVLMLSALPPLLLALIPSPVIWDIHFHKKLQIAILILVFPVLISLFRYNRLLLSANQKMQVFSSYDKRGAANAHRFISQNYTALKNEPYFVFPYAMYFCNDLDDKRELKILEDAAQRLPSVEIVCKLGKQYQKLHACKNAEQCFIESTNAVPARILPNYYLLQLYRSEADTTAAVQVADKILHQQIKRENTVTIKTKAIVRHFLKGISQNSKARESK